MKIKSFFLNKSILRFSSIVRPSERRIQFFFLAICFCLSSCSKSANGTSEMPNIIYVLADDLGIGDISIYNAQGKIMTPHINQLAKDGMRFTDAHTSSSVCTPTRYGILTGRYNWRSPLKNGVLTGKSKALISGSRSTVASMLKKQGYQTGFIGKWHLGWDWALKYPDTLSGEGWNAGDFGALDFSKPISNGPNDLGFDYAYGLSGSLDMAPYVYVENRMPTMIPDTITQNTGRYSWWRKGPTSKDFVHEDATPNFFRKSFDFISEKAQGSDPFFLYLALPSPHTPILPTKAWEGKSNLNPYADFVMMIDAYMGQLIETIQKAGIEHNTMVIFTSDNGCSPQANYDLLRSKGHDPSSIYRGHKADIFEGGHRVPFIVKWPETISKNTVSIQTICTTDLMATCAEISDYELMADEAEDSYSLMSLFKQTQEDRPLREATVHHSINGSFAIRQGDWKLILCPDSGGWSAPKPTDKAALDSLPKYQLYDIRTDPGERTNLIDLHPEKAASLKALLISYISEGRSTPGEPQENDPIDFEWKQIAFANSSDD